MVVTILMHTVFSPLFKRDLIGFIKSKSMTTLRFLRNRVILFSKIVVQIYIWHFISRYHIKFHFQMHILFLY